MLYSDQKLYDHIVDPSIIFITFNSIFHQLRIRLNRIIGLQRQWNL